MRGAAFEYWKPASKRSSRRFSPCFSLIVKFLRFDFGCGRTLTPASGRGSKVTFQGIRSSAPNLALRNLLRIRSEEHTSELQSLMRISYAVFCLKKKKEN